MHRLCVGWLFFIFIMQLGWLLFHIILFAPQIPPNTGNIIRLSANTGVQLHLIEPLGFRLDEKSCRRAGLDYHTLADVHLHKNLDDCVKTLGSARLFAITSHGTASLFDQKFTAGDAFLFGSETAGLPNPFILFYRRTQIAPADDRWQPVDEFGKCGIYCFI